jgi:MOSC domain-containing protein YiiM
MTERSNGVVDSIHISNGGVPKPEVPSVSVFQDRLEGDDHNDRVGHGGPDRAVCIYSIELIDALRGEGHPIFPGSAGENLTVGGLEWGKVLPGVMLRAGDTLLEVTSFTSPCKTIRNSFVNGEFKRISQKVNPGWSRVYARVLETGTIAKGDMIQLIP